MNEVTVLVHAGDQLRTPVLRAVTEQDPLAIRRDTPVRRPFVYGDWFRAMWAGLTGVIWCEQDVVPPPAAIWKLRECPRPWCTHPLWVGDRHAYDTFGLVKFSETLCRNLPLLADIVCTEHDARYWVRRGWTNIPRDCSVATLNGPGRRACLRSDAPATAYATEPRSRPTIRTYFDIDVQMSRALRVLGLEPCVHTPQAKHLHDYSSPTRSTAKPWHQLPYDAVDWPID